MRKVKEANELVEIDIISQVEFQETKKEFKI